MARGDHSGKNQGKLDKGGRQKEGGSLVPKSVGTMSGPDRSAGVRHRIPE